MKTPEEFYNDIKGNHSMSEVMKMYYELKSGFITLILN